MNDWTKGLSDAVEYIERHITEPLDIKDIAACAYVSPFYFQRIFGSLCGFTVGEYIRGRRLTLAAQELASSDIRVIDCAVKYGYDSPDSFARAFTRFHGITPSAARERGARLNSVAPLKIKLTLEGGTMIEYKIVEKAAFTVMGFEDVFYPESSYQEIPKFWDRHFASGGGEVICGRYGVCADMDGKSFRYLIADDYVPYKELPQGCVTFTFPAGTWVVFPCTMKTLQDVNTKIWNEWLPSCREYELSGNYNVELYTPVNASGDAYCELWFPVKKAEK